MLTILTHPPTPFSIETFKYHIRRLFGNNRGPLSVLGSLKDGLEKNHVAFQINPSKRNTCANVHVLSGIEALKYSIGLKKAGKIDQLIAGPNLVITPLDYNKILCNPEIDAVLVPSEWIKKFYSDLAPEISNKIFIWPAGTNMDNINLKERRTECIVYKKDVPDEVYNSIIHALKKRKIKFVLIEYGKFNREKYFKLLERSKFMIYLQAVESQGIALQEAWARNVPTLVWNKGSFTYPDGQTVTGNISAPYLNEQTGMFFENTNTFEDTLEKFMSNLSTFNPHQYCQYNLSDTVSAEKYVNIVKSINK